MKPVLSSPWLLAVATSIFGGAGAAVVPAAPGDPVHHLPLSVPRPAEDPDKEPYPMWQTVHSPNPLNLTRVWHVHKCLQDWCDNREVLWEEGGKVTCRSDHQEGDNIVAWICNVGHYRRVCSAAMINMGAKHMISQMDEYRANHPAGHVYYTPDYSHSFIIGWDTYCDGSPSCGGYRDPTIVCENAIDKYGEGTHPKPPQYEAIANGYGSAHHEGYQVEDEGKSGNGESSYDGVTVEMEDGRGGIDDEEAEFEKFKLGQALKDAKIAEQPIRNKMWPATQEKPSVEGVSPINIHNNPAHGKHGGR
ncbi:hypothetical protein QBC41DRAFT_224615 [Cercophora samala]|uniref:Uncharacterized protein n=1 Tax=Cercophora samala TaxID=330535 RepID=A0AA39ZDV9_9PEZI|nr:hypothetical protein QBC41DRAFT_224615 [Cercophora samala]